MVVGGTASVLGGGKFENGAMTAAFAALYNDFGFGVDKTQAAGNGHTSLYFQDRESNWYKYDQFSTGGTSAGDGDVQYLMGLDTPAGVNIQQLQINGIAPTHLFLPAGAVTYGTTPVENAKIYDSALRSADAYNTGKANYNLYSNNCTDAAVSVINNAHIGIKIPNSAFTVRPRSWIQELKQSN
jgi:hypothetical protein